MGKIKKIAKSVFCYIKRKYEAKFMAILAYVIFFMPLLLGHAKKDGFIKFHVQQGEVLFVIIASTAFFDYIKPWYWGLVDFLINFLYFIFFVYMILGIFNVIKEKKTPLPYIGKYAKYFNI